MQKLDCNVEISKRIEAFKELGRRMRNISPEKLFTWSFEAESKNKWFTAENVKSAVAAIGEMLKESAIDNWLNNYKLTESSGKKVGVVMAGNIPMAGFHDLMCVLISGNKLFAKLSSDDEILMKKVATELIEINNAFDNYIQFGERLKGMDAVIATGSDNTSRYFKYYFSHIPNVIRGNRNSVAVLNGNESYESLQRLGDDVFKYFGLGCRSVSKLYVPAGYSLNAFLGAVDNYKDIIHHNKYFNNYEYHKAVLLLNKVSHLDNGFLLLREDEALASGVSLVYYEYYANQEELSAKLESNKNKIQVVLSDGKWLSGSEDFGMAQCPSIDDYADGVDTLKFLINLS
ncbi:MAG: acyl-CoA reductase [Cytophagaceae bacterium]